MDYYFDRQRCVDRLLAEYDKHKALIIATDLDDTCYNFHAKEDRTYDDVLSLLKECSDMGWPIIILTAGKPERYPDMIEYMELNKINIASINKNYIDGMTYGNWGKPYYNILLDDRAGLYEAYSILFMVVNKIKNK